MKKSSKKLALARETLGTLTAQQLEDANGATGGLYPAVGPIIANPIDKYAYGRSAWGCPGPTAGVFTCGP